MAYISQYATMETAFLNRQRNIFRARYNNYLADEKVKNPGVGERDRVVYEAEVRVWKHSFGEKTPFPGKFPDPNAASENKPALPADEKKEDENHENGDTTIENLQEETQPKPPNHRPPFRPKVNRNTLIYDPETQLISNPRRTSSTTSPFPFLSLSTQPQTTEETQWPKGRDLESKRKGNVKVERTMGRPMDDSFLFMGDTPVDVEWQREMERRTAERRARRAREHPDVHRRMMEIRNRERRGGRVRGGGVPGRINAINPDRGIVGYNPINPARGMGELGVGVEKESEAEKGESATGEEIVGPATTARNKRQREDDEEEAPPGRERIRQRIRRNPRPPRMY